jgi:hypothetical protein
LSKAVKRFVAGRARMETQLLTPWLAALAGHFLVLSLFGEAE